MQTKNTMIPKVVLEDPQTQEYRDQMKVHALIYKFMGLWPIEKTLRSWINYHWKPSGEVDLHLGSKGFFTVVFINLEDRDKVFEGGPYFHASVGLYMRPWKEKISPEKETFKCVPVWIRLYSLPLDYWLLTTFEAIGNKLGKFVKASDATLKGKYTSFARIYIEMDVSGALPEAICLEFRDEEWIQNIDYEQIMFRCRRCHEHENIFRECPLNKKTEQAKTKQPQDEEDFLRPNYKGKENRRQSKPSTFGNPQSRNKFEGLAENQTQDGEMGQEKQGEREPGVKEENKAMENQHPQDTTIIYKGSTGDRNTDTNSPMQEGDGDFEMTPNEVRIEDPYLRDIVEREGINLRNIMEQCKKQGMDTVGSIPKRKARRFWERKHARGKR
jgi:hypothetical protein